MLTISKIVLVSICAENATHGADIEPEETTTNRGERADGVGVVESLREW